SREDHARKRRGGVEGPSPKFVELVLVHLLLVPDGHAWRMDEKRHLARLRPLPERKGGFAVDELTVPAGRDQQPLEAEGTEAPLALGDVTCVERIEGAETPVAFRAAPHRG